MCLSAKDGVRVNFCVRAFNVCVGLCLTDSYVGVLKSS